MPARSADTGKYINFTLILICFPKLLNPKSMPGAQNISKNIAAVSNVWRLDFCTENKPFFLKHTN